MRKKHILLRISGVALALAMLLQTAPAAAFAKGMGDDVRKLKVAVISDIHVIPPNMLGDNPDAASAIASDRKMFVESSAILDSAIAEIIAQSPDVVIIPGDLTKDGELASHIYVADKLAEITAALPGVKIYVINGNHDINNPHAFDYSGGSAVPVKSADAGEFREIYAGFGYGDAMSEYYTPSVGQAGSNSYAARPAEGFTVIAIDACKYSADATRSGLDSQEHGGRISDELLSWVLQKAMEANERGDVVIAFMHHGLAPHFSLEPALLADFLADNYIEVSEALADAGVRYVFTGHMHAQNIASITSAAGNTLYDIETGSLITYPCPVRFAVFSDNSRPGIKRAVTVDIVTTLIKEVDFTDPSTGGLIDDLTQYSYETSLDKETVKGLITGVVFGGFMPAGGILDILLPAGGILDTLLPALVDMPLFTDDDGAVYDFFDFAKYVYLAHLGGDAVSQPWVEAIIHWLQSGDFPTETAGFLSDILLRGPGGVAFDAILSDSLVIGLCAMVAELAISMIEGSGSGVGDNNARLIRSAAKAAKTAKAAKGS